MKYLLTILLSAVLFFSCKQERLEKTKYQYFDLSGFMDEEANRLSAKNFQVDKTVFLNGKEEKKTLTISNWQHELNAFKDTDINKKSFLGKYSVDSSYQAGNTLVKYAALDEKFKTREISIQFDKAKNPVRITATVSTDNVLYKSVQQLIYEVGWGYYISGQQSVRFLNPDSFYVKALFTPLPFDSAIRFIPPDAE